jgi:hypothetical protein
MKSRFSSVLVVLLLLAVFGLGVFLLVIAEEMPAPGLILMALSGGAFLFRLFARGGARSAVGSSARNPFAGSAQASESYDYDMERRRRGEFDDMDASQGSRH